MGEFFKGWRRKAGIVTLAMALVLTAGWMRSVGHLDVVWIQTNNWSFAVYSASGGFHEVLEEGGDSTSWYGWISTDIGPGEHPGEVPYWHCILPLTLLSAWLILGKRRQAKPTNSEN